MSEFNLPKDFRFNLSALTLLMRLSQVRLVPIQSDEYRRHVSNVNATAGKAEQLCHDAIERAQASSAAAIARAEEGNLRVWPAEWMRATSLRQQPRRRNSELDSLRERFPELSRQVVGVWRQVANGRGHSAHLEELHQFWLHSLWELGIAQHEYPFSTRTRGYAAFCNWLDAEVPRV